MREAAAIDPTGFFAIHADAARDHLIILRRENTQWVPHKIIPQRPGSGPIQILFHPGLPVVYACNAGNSTITAHHWDGAAGHLAFAQSLRLLPLKFSGPNHAIGMAIAPSGRYLYAVVSGHNSIATAAIQRGKGKIFLRAREILTKSPQAGPVLDATGTIMQIGPDLRYAVQPANGTIARLCPPASAISVSSR